MIVCSVLVFAATAQSPTISVSLLETPTKHDCTGKVRVIVNNCVCGTSAAGIWHLSFGPAPGYTYPASSGNYNLDVCGQQQIIDIDVLPGEYIFTASVEPDPNGCHNVTETRTFNITVPNANCTPPILNITGTTPETNLNCANGTVSFSGVIDMCGVTGILFELFDSANNLIQSFGGNVLGAGLSRTFGGLVKGNYTLKAYHGPGNIPCTDTPIARQSFSISRENECLPPVCTITNTTSETGNGCNNGTISINGHITMCAMVGLNFKVFDSAHNLLQESDGNIFGAGLDRTFGGFKKGKYYVRVTNGGFCTDKYDEKEVSIARDPVNVSFSAEVKTQTGVDGCRRDSIVCNYNDNYNQKSCLGDGPSVWAATLTGTTENGQEINIDAQALFGHAIVFTEIPAGSYTAGGSRAIPGPKDGPDEEDVVVDADPCNSSLSHTIVSTNPNKGIGCDSAAVVEFTFTSNACYQNWTLLSPDIQLFGGDGSWSAPKGQTIRISLPASFDGTAYNYQFYAQHDADRYLDCVARDNVNGVPSLGCDATITGTKTKDISVPGASDAEYSFTLNTSSCLDAPWHVVMKHSTTGEEYPGSAQSKNEPVVIDGLPAGNYTWSFEFAGASGCGNPNAGGGGLDCNNPVTVYQDNDGDGFGNAALTSTACFPGSLGGYVGNSSDSNDGLITYNDNDGDGFGSGNPAPSGVPNNTDADDSNPFIFPNAPEVCDGVDNNGDGILDTLVMPGLILYMPLDGNAIDRTSNALNGTINGSVTATADRFGNANGAMYFPGNTASYIRVNDNPLVRPSSITLSAWVNMSSQPGHTGFITKSINCINDSWHFGSQGGNYSTWISNSTNCGDFLQMTSPNSVGNWHHVAFTLDDVNDTRKLYVDGVMVASGAYTSSIPYDANPVLIGAAIENGNLDFPFHGSLDEVMIFNRAVSDAEVADLFTKGSPYTDLKKTYYADADGDGFGNPALSKHECTQPAGYVLNNTDCNDNSALAHPGLSEICGDGIDNDCDGHVDSVYAAEFTTGLVAYYPLNGNANETINGGSGVTNGGVQPATNRLGNAGSANNFNGSNGYIDISNNTAIPSSGQVSVSAWIKYNTSGANLNWFKKGTVDGYGLYVLNNTVYVITYNHVNWNTGVVLTAGSWHHITFTFDGTTQKIYKEGVLAASINAGYNPASGFAAIGYNSQCSECGYFNGDIDEVKIFNIALSDAQVFDNYNLLLAPLSKTYYADVDGDGYGNPSVFQEACIQPAAYVLNNTDCDDNNASINPVMQVLYIWTGSGNNRLWDNPANWNSCGGVPPSGANVIISNVANKPVMNADLVVGNIKLEGTSDISITDKMLTINGAVSGTGSLNVVNTSSLVITGNAGAIRFTQTKDTIKNVSLQQNASVTISNMLYVKAGTQPGVITLQQGAVLNVNGNLTLLSDINGTARVAQIPVDGSGNALATINGDVTVERFIPKNTYKAWQSLSIPTKGAQTIKQGWQENQNAGMIGLTGYGTSITTAAGFLQNGFDAVTTKTSMQSFNPATGGLINITSTLVPAETKYGYFIYVRGDRSIPVNGSTHAVNATKLRTKGSLYTGNQTVLSCPANTSLMVGNIYASAIDFTLLPKTGGIGNSFSIWDPKLNNGTTLGAYQTFSATNAYAPVIPGGSYSGPNTIIQSGQAFFVKAAGAAGTVQLVEGAKFSGTVVNAFRPLEKREAINVKLLADINGSLYTADVNTIVFSSRFTDEGNGDDAPKFLNPGENIASSNTNGLFAIEARSDIALQKSVQYYISNLRQQQYRLDFEFKSVAEQGREVYLEDAYLKRTILLDCSGIASYPFTVNADTASANANRFRLAFGKEKGSIITQIAEQKINISPNPVDAHYFNLNLFGFSKGKYKMKLLGQTGELIYAYSANAVEGNSSVKIVLSNKPAAGIYTVELIDVNKKHFIDRIIFK